MSPPSESLASRTRGAGSCVIASTSDLPPDVRRALFELAADATGPTFDPTYLERRLDTYPTIAIVRDAHGLAAFGLVDVRRRDVHLVYLGPVFSKRGAYVLLFAHCLRTWLDSGEAFCIGAEIENPLVRGMLSLLLPTSAHPRVHEVPSANARELARLFARELPHIVDFDERTMTTAITATPSGPRPLGARYHFAVVPCPGDGDARARIRAELERGLDTLATMRGRGRGEEERVAASTR